MSVCVGGAGRMECPKPVHPISLLEKLRWLFNMIYIFLMVQFIGPEKRALVAYNILILT